MTQYTSLATPIVDEVYRTNSNYRIQKGRGKGRLYLFFSGNGLYFPNDERTFSQVVVQQDRYEWTSVARGVLSAAQEIIYIRDVYKRWYVTGISEALPSPDTVIGELARLTEGKEVVTVGNSAGGYMAILAGIKLNARAVYAFNPQIDLSLISGEDHPFVSERLDVIAYPNLSEMVKDSSVPVFFFYAAGNADDVAHAGLLKGAENVSFFPFDETIHGKSVLAVQYARLLLAPQRLPALADKITDPISARRFLFKEAGWMGGLVLYGKSIVTRAWKKLCKNKKSHRSFIKVT